MTEAVAGDGEVHIISRRTIRPSSSPSSSTTGDDGKKLHLTPWDLQLIALGHIQKGILLPPPPPHLTTDVLVARLASSLASTLDHFFPLAGRFAAIHHREADPPRISLALDCTGDGVEFVHATARSATAVDVLSPTLVPSVIALFFPLRGAANVDSVCGSASTSCSAPLLGVQVTQLADGSVFVGCSLNHAAADGSSFWDFFNAWSEISRTGGTIIYRPPSTARWFLSETPPPVLLPFASTSELRSTFAVTPRALSECALHFSPASVAKLKEEANRDTGGGGGGVSSLQALLAHVWRYATRARGLGDGEETGYGLAVGHRARLCPPLPAGYLGNAVRMMGPVRVDAGELLRRPLGWAAWKLNRTVASQTDGCVRRWLASWAESPNVRRAGGFERGDLFTGSSPRFDVFGNDFGWGAPTAVRSGGANKFDGKVTAYPGPEAGSIGLEVCLESHALLRLLDDREFMEFVGPAISFSGED